MTFKNIIFKTNKEGLDSIIKYSTNPEGRVEETKKREIEIKIIEKKKDTYKVKITTKEAMTTAAYDTLMLYALYNSNLKLHNIKFFIEENDTASIEKFLFDRENWQDKKNRFYLKHMQKNPEDKTQGTYTAKISCHDKPTKDDALKVMSFLRKYL